MKQKRVKFIVMCLCVLAVGMFMLSGCSLLPKKKPAEPAVTGQPPPINPIQQRIRKRQNLALKTHSQQERNRLNAEIAEQMRALNQAKGKKLFPETFAVSEVPEGDLFVYKASLETNTGFDGAAVCNIVFEAAEINKQIMAYTQTVKIVDGVPVVLRMPDKMVFGAKGIRCVMPVEKSKIPNRLQMLTPVARQVDPSDPGSTINDFRIIRFICNDTRAAPPRRPGVVRGPDLYTANNWLPSDYFAKKQGVVVVNGEVHILDDSCLKFVNREIKFVP